MTMDPFGGVAGCVGAAGGFDRAAVSAVGSVQASRAA